MRYWLLSMAIGVLGGMAHAQSAWFTVVGDPLDAAADTVQVDPTGAAPSAAPPPPPPPIQAPAPAALPAPLPAAKPAEEPAPAPGMNLRVNRSGPRHNWDGVPYRSYESRVVFDCQARRAAYVAARFYIEPLWRGEPHHVADYSAAPKPMLFRDMKQNPTARIVRAACRGTSS